MKIFFPLILIIVVISSCKEISNLDDAGLKKLKPDTDYYCSATKTWVRFTNISPDLKGYFFVDSGKAEAVRFPFVIVKKRTKLLACYTIEKPDKLKIKDFEIGDNSFSIGKEEEKQVFIAEKPLPYPEKNGRYSEEVFKKFNVKTVKYGTARGYYDSKLVEKLSEDQYPSILADVSKSLAKNFMMEDLALQMDIYTPMGDSCKFRPLLMLYHGGAFILGDKSSETMKGLAEYFVKRGYVVASVNYRLGFWMLPGAQYLLERAVYRATQDARASVRYMVANAKEYGIDPDHIYTAGNSAGGFIALNTALMKDDSYYPSRKADLTLLLDDLGCLDCSTNSFKNTFKIKAVINMWGALTHIRMLVDNPEIPILCFHGDSDKLIPVETDLPFANISRELSSFFTEKVYGSGTIYKYAKVTKTPVSLKLFHGQGHDPHVNDDGSLNKCFDTIMFMSRDFLYSYNLPPAAEISGNINPAGKDPIPEYSVKNRGNNNVFWKVNGGKIISEPNISEKIRVIWFRGQEKELYAALRNRNHAVSYASRKVSVK